MSAIHSTVQRHWFGRMHPPTSGVRTVVLHKILASACVAPFLFWACPSASQEKSKGLDCSWTMLTSIPYQSGNYTLSDNDEFSFKERFLIRLDEKKIYSNRVRGELAVHRFEESVIDFTQDYTSLAVVDFRGDQIDLGAVAVKFSLDRISGDFSATLPLKIGDAKLSFKSGSCSIRRFF
ncbi:MULTISPECIES: hypothetical protein [unclassified Phenylobacterium]|uniref:hypothetical protein n=1 Tax=unclassified Phenylobacterium TaxID=2640670 RepID=UPI0012E90266|nr:MULTISPECIES: hypothetical protein [unclassified Phenylobacterium]